MASKTKIYFWIKLDANFFKNLAIKNLRRTVSGGDTMVLIYQQMLLSSLPNNGVIFYEGTLQDIAQEIALTIDEKLDDVKLTIDYFQKAGLLQIGDDGSAEMLQVPMLIGQETNWNKYKRDKRLENFQSTSNQLPTSSNFVPTEIEIELEKEKEIKKESESKKDKEEITIQEIFDFYQSNFGIISPSKSEQLRELTKENPNELVFEALKSADNYNAKSPIDYSSSILSQWARKNIKSLEDVETERMLRSKKAGTNNKSVKPAPKWANNGQPPEEEELTPEEAEAFFNG